MEKANSIENRATNEALNNFASLPKYSERAIKNLQEKKENPFWMPSKNEEIFEVRDIMRQEKELKRAINRTKQMQKTQETLGDSMLESSTNVYLTEQKGNSNFNDFMDKFNKLKSNHEKTLETNAHTNPSDSMKQSCLPISQPGTNLLLKITEKKEKEVKKEGVVEKSKKDLLQKKLSSIGGKRQDNVREYINKTRDLILIKYSIDVKKERAVRLKETYSNEIESIKDSIFSMEEAKKLFENEFYVKFEKYVKYLMKQKEHEKNEETNLLEAKMKLDAEKSKLINKITKLEKEKKNYEECQHFMIMVKEKMLAIPDNFKLDYAISSRREKDELNESALYVTAVQDPNMKQKLKAYFSGVVPNDDKEKFDRIRGYFGGDTIFDSPKDLLDEIKKMESDNIKKLSNFNDINYNLREAEKELNRLREDERKTFETNISDIENKERTLKELKDKYTKLNEEKHLLISENPDYYLNANKKGRNRRLSIRNKFAEPQLFSKILEVHKSANQLNQNPNEFEINKKSTKEADMSMLIMLQHIEKSLDYMITKYFDFSKCTNLGPKLKEIEGNLDQERKLKKNKDMKIQNLIDEHRKIKEMEERNNRIYVIPKRKIPERCPPKDKGDKEKKNDKDENKDLNFEDFIDF